MQWRIYPQMQQIQKGELSKYYILLTLIMADNKKPEDQ